MTNVPLLLTVWQELCVSTQQKAWAISANVRLVSLEMAEAVETVVLVCTEFNISGIYLKLGC